MSERSIEMEVDAFFYGGDISSSYLAAYDEYRFDDEGDVNFKDEKNQNITINEYIDSIEHEETDIEMQDDNSAHMDDVAHHLQRYPDSGNLGDGRILDVIDYYSKVPGLLQWVQDPNGDVQAFIDVMVKTGDLPKGAMPSATTHFKLYGDHSSAYMDAEPHIFIPSLSMIFDEEHYLEEYGVESGMSHWSQYFTLNSSGKQIFTAEGAQRVAMGLQVSLEFQPTEGDISPYTACFFVGQDERNYILFDESHTVRKTQSYSEALDIIRGDDRESFDSLPLVGENLQEVQIVGQISGQEMSIVF